MTRSFTRLLPLCGLVLFTACSHESNARKQKSFAAGDDAFQELKRTIALEPDNYRAHTDLANILIASRNPDNLKEAKLHLDILRAKQPNAPETHQSWASF